MEKIGESVTGGQNRKVQVRKARAGTCTKAKRNACLDHLATTSNVAHSARMVGLTPQNAHALRRRDAGFGEAWADALEQGYAHIEAQLLSCAIGQQDDDERQPVATDKPFDPEMGLRVLASRKNMASPNRLHGGTRVARVSIEQVERSLRTKLDALAKRLKADF